MGTESKGIAWFGNIYRKLETILLEADDYASKNSIRYADGRKVGVAGTGPGSNVGQCMLSSESSALPVLTFARDEEKEVMENNSSDSVHSQQCQDCPALPSSKNPSDPPSEKNFDILENVHLDERVEGDGVKEKLSDSMLAAEEVSSRALLLEDCINCDQTAETSLCNAELILLQDMDRGSYDSRITNFPSSQTFSCGDPSILPCKEKVEEAGVNICGSTVATGSHFTNSFPESIRKEVACNGNTVECSSGDFSGDSNLHPLATAVPDVLVEDNMAKMRPSGSKPLASIGDQDDFCTDELDAASLETIELYDMANREDHSDFDDSLLYAVRHRTRKLRSFKRKILDAIASKRRLEKEYEQLAIWFGDTYMGSDLNTPEVLFPSGAATTLDFKSSQPTLASEDSEWELVDKPHIY